MKTEIDYDKIEPMEIYYRWTQETKDKMLDLKIFKEKNWELIVPSFKCEIHKNDKIKKDYFPFMHQVFWFNLMELKDVNFALSDLEICLQWANQFTFPNWTMVKLFK